MKIHRLYPNTSPGFLYHGITYDILGATSDAMVSPPRVPFIGQNLRRIYIRPIYESPEPTFIVCRLSLYLDNYRLGFFCDSEPFFGGLRYKPARFWLEQASPWRCRTHLERLYGKPLTGLSIHESGVSVRFTFGLEDVSTVDFMPHTSGKDFGLAWVVLGEASCR